jgi:hypothetical protein
MSHEEGHVLYNAVTVNLKISIYLMSHEAGHVLYNTVHLNLKSDT